MNAFLAEKLPRALAACAFRSLSRSSRASAAAKSGSSAAATSSACPGRLTSRCSACQPKLAISAYIAPPSRMIPHLRPLPSCMCAPPYVVSVSLTQPPQINNCFGRI